MLTVPMPWILSPSGRPMPLLTMFTYCRQQRNFPFMSQFFTQLFEGVRSMRLQPVNVQLSDSQQRTNRILKPRELEKYGFHWRKSEEKYWKYVVY